MKDPIDLATPFFVVLLVIEAIVAWRRRQDLYRFTDAVTDLGAGILSQLALVFLGGALLGVYAWVYQFRVVELSAHPVLMWVIALVGLDFLYYWWHRASHEVNFLWAGHVVHHSSEDYNLAVALRQAIVTHVTSRPFYLPLALLGVPPAVYVASYGINLIYQFWIHTELIDKLGPVETVFNTPSHHRVHHAINPRYLDRNYAGIFIVWDRLFGSFEPESEECVYGITRALRSYNPIYLQFHYWGELYRLSRRAPNTLDKLRVWWKPPTFVPAGLPAPEAATGITRATRPKYEPSPSRAALIYGAVQFATAMGLSLVLMDQRATLPIEHLAIGSALVAVTFLATSGLFEQRPWARPLEAARLVTIAAITVFAFGR